VSESDDRVAVVTGAGSGIGKAVAERLAADGYAVACLDIAGHEETAATLGGRAMAQRCDVTDYASVESAVAAATEQLGAVTHAANIAGIGHFRHSHEESPEAFAKIIAVNLQGTFNVCRAVLPAMVEAKRGSIVNTASNAGLMGQPWSAAYCASKGGVVMLTKALAYEYTGAGIRVNAVAPGGVETPIANSFGFPEGVDFKRLIKIMSPLGMMKPSEIASTFAYVLDESNSFLTGSIFVHDGGLTA
jgi:NAD(P)-dependent dehydrogenase (short-subunit alcohol dehydrogenase family)